MGIKVEVPTEKVPMSPDGHPITDNNFNTTHLVNVMKIMNWQEYITLLNTLLGIDITNDTAGRIFDMFNTSANFIDFSRLVATSIVNQQHAIIVWNYLQKIYNQFNKMQNVRTGGGRKRTRRAKKRTASRRRRPRKH